MKNPYFVDPEVISKQEILAKLKGDEYSHSRFSPEGIEWLDSITNDITLTLEEADVIYKLFEAFDDIPALLFDRRFFPVVQDDSDFLILKRFFRTDLLNDCRIISIPLLFKKIGGKETFHKSVSKIIKKIKAHCDQNEEFAKAYHAKLAEIRNNNGPIQERLGLYIGTYLKELTIYKDLIYELEQPSFEMLKECLNDTAILQDRNRIEFFFLELLFIFLLQTPDGMQIPKWNEENYKCRLLLDSEIVYKTGILDKLFNGYTTTDVFLIICNHLKWRYDNMPQYQAGNSLNSLYEEYAKFLEAKLPELFNCGNPHKFLDLFYCLFFFPNEKQGFVHIDRGLRDVQYLNVLVARDSEQLIKSTDFVKSFELGFLNSYLTKKIASMISENNYEQIRELSRLFENGNKDWIGKIDWEKTYSDGTKEKFLEGLQSRIFSAMKSFESGDNVQKLQDILKASKNDYILLKPMLISLMKSKIDKNVPPLSLEDFVLKYIPLELFPKILHFDFFWEQNEDEYQRIIEQYPGLSREDALLDRLSPCFAAIAIKNTDEIPAMLDRAFSPMYFDEPNAPRYDSEVQLFLYVLDQLCKRHDKEHEYIALIFEIIFRNKYYVPVMFDIIKKYPQVQQLVFEQCYTVLKGSWDTPILTPISSHQIQAGVPARIIGLHKGAWHGLKQLLIAMRKTGMEWVDESLNINNDCHPDGSYNLVEEIKLYFYFFYESLKSLRQDMADDLSDWLKPLPESKRDNLKTRLAEFPKIEQAREGFNITYTEPDPIWRYAYVRAIADLGVDVDGKGHYIHSVMDKVAKEDPSQMVRKAAEKTSAKLKGLRKGWDGKDHYQKITLAFWWIKQASRLALNLPIDRESSLKTRSLEGQKKEQMEKEKRKREVERWVRQMREEEIEEERWVRQMREEEMEIEEERWARQMEEKREIKQRVEKLLRARLKI